MTKGTTVDEMDEIVQEFLVESYENLDQLDRDLVALEQEPGSRELLGSIFRTIHTIKGTSGFLAFPNLEAVTHVGENLLAQLRDGKRSMDPTTTDVLLSMVDVVRELLTVIEKQGTEDGVDVTHTVEAITLVLEGTTPAMAVANAATVAPATQDSPAAAPTEATSDTLAVEEETPQIPAGVHVPQPATEERGDDEHVAGRRNAADSSIRVDVELLDTLMRQVGELVLSRNQIVRQATEFDDPSLAQASQRLNLIVTEVQEGVMKTRMQPIDHIWSKMPRVVRDLGNALGKKVHLEMIGRETELDRTLLEAVKDPLTHLVRNGVDHGLETTAERLAAGKSAEGTLTLRAYHEGGQVVVEVTDDGAGIDPEKIAAKALQKGMRTADQLALMPQADVLQLIFAPGFSTAATVTNVSGRGVGMDVVRTNIEAIGGAIEVESVVGQRTTCRLRIPLTLAIVPALTVECASDRYAIPQVSLLELVALDADRAATALEEVNGAAVYRLRGSLLPLVRLADVLGVESDRSDGHVLIAVLQAENRRFGLIIDRVLNTEEIVVKPLDARLKAIGAYSGATILGDGRVALILDVQALARRAMSTEALERTTTEERASESVKTASDHVRMLIAGIGSGRRVAIPLSSVTRLENIAADKVEYVGGREMVQYRGQILPLVRLDRHLGAISERQGDDHIVIVYTSGDRSVAIVVDEIIDIVDEVSETHSDIDGPGLLGSTLIKDRIVELLDVRSAILAADPHFFTERHDGTGFDDFAVELDAADFGTHPYQEAM